MVLNSFPVRGRAKLVNKSQITRYIHELRFEMVEPAEMNFKAGQYIAVIIDPSTRRQYSISTTPKFSKKTFETLVDSRPNGPGVKHMLGLDIGGEIKFIGNIGKFVLPAELSDEIYFIATGAGVAPLKSMIDMLIADGSYVNKKIHLVFGTRTAEDIVCENLFNEYVAKGYLVDYEIYLSQEDNSKYKSGYVTNHFKEIDGRLFKGAQFFMCGNNYMIDDVTALLLENDVPEENIFYEKFY